MPESTRAEPGDAYPHDVRTQIGRLFQLAREHPFSVAQIALLVVFVTAATIAGFLVDPAAGFGALAGSALVSCVVMML